MEEEVRIKKSKKLEMCNSKSEVLARTKKLI